MVVIFTYCLLACTIIRCVLFYKREQGWWKALVPFYNKRVLGNLCDSKKLGTIVSFISFIFYLTVFLAISIEFYILDSLNNITLSEIEIETFNIYDYVSVEAISANSVSKLFLLGIAILYFIVWAILMRKFSEKNTSSTWWMLLWALVPIVPYVYFSFIKKEYYIPGQGVVKYSIKKEKCEVKNLETISKKEGKKKR